MLKIMKIKKTKLKTFTVFMNEVWLVRALPLLNNFFKSVRNPY